MQNRFIGSAGGAEKRQGIEQWGTALPSGVSVTGLHELLLKDGTAIQFASGSGQIWRRDSDVLWTLVHTMALNTGRLISVQMGDRLIFANGEDRQIATTDGTTFTQLEPIIEQGTMASASTTGFNDNEVSALGGWTATAFAVNINDLVYNATVSAYGLVVAVAAASVTHTAIGSGATGLGKTTANSSSGHRYRVLDLVELNIIPTASELDNVAVAAAGTNATTIAVSGLAFTSVDEIRVGDVIYNSTRAAVAMVSAIGTNLTVTSVAAQTTGDALTFFKSAMPIAETMAVHFNRLYNVDARDKRKVRISGANDPQDMTTDAATLDPITVNFDLASRGDIVKAIGSFQRFLILAGRRAIYVYQGTTPIGPDADLEVIGSFPVGLVSKYGLLNIGNDLLFLTEDGVQSLRLIVDANAVQKANIAEPVRVSMRDLIADNTEEDLQLIGYPKRSWALAKLGTELYCYNYTSGVIDPDNPFGGSWSRFDGPFAQQNSYFVDNNGVLICGGADGKVYRFDVGVYSDDGQSIPTEYKCGWLTMEEDRYSRGTVRQKEGKYLKALLQGQGAIQVTFSGEGGFDGQGNASAMLSTTGFTTPIGDFEIGASSIGGSVTANIKVPFRWRGEVFRLTVTTQSTLGPDILGRFTVYHNMLGRR